MFIKSLKKNVNIYKNLFNVNKYNIIVPYLCLIYIYKYYKNKYIRY